MSAALQALDAGFPKKRISAGAIIRNGRGELLVVKPIYREGWLLPGGICEKDEAPAFALLRELQEELGIAPDIESLASVDYLSPAAGFGEAINFLFRCRELSDAESTAIVLDGTELSEFRFCTDAAAAGLLVPSIAARLARLEAGATIYLENGAPALPRR